MPKTQTLFLAFVIFLFLVFFYHHFRKKQGCQVAGWARRQAFNKEKGIWFIDFGEGEKSIAFISGVHGNEPAGCAALSELIDSGFFAQEAKKRGMRIRVIPCVNTWGLKYNSRYQPNILHPDINRNFHGSGGLDTTSREIIDLITKFDVVVDFHEGWGFHRVQPQSVGSTISPGPTNLARRIAREAVELINQKITLPFKKFMVLEDNSCEIPQTLACHRKARNDHYLLVETSGQNDVQPLEVRKSQVQDVVYAALEVFTNQSYPVNGNS